MYHILVVDDEPRIRSIIKKYAEFEGYTVTEAADGMEAVHFCRSAEFDIIIMDIMMPELDGFSACREIRKISQTPIIMLSARGEEYDKINGFELGIDDYVVKPFSPKELMLRIDAVMKRTKRAADGGVKKENLTVTLDDGGLRADITARLVFIDGDKREYTAYYEMLFEHNLVHSNSFILADNILWYGKVIEEVARKDKQTQEIIAFNDYVRNDSRVENVILPLRDGINLIRVK